MHFTSIIYNQAHKIAIKTIIITNPNNTFSLKY